MVSKHIPGYFLLRVVFFFVQNFRNNKSGTPPPLSTTWYDGGWQNKCAKFQGLPSKTWREHLDLCAENMGWFAWLRSYYFVSVWNQLWELYMTWYWPYAFRYSSICLNVLQTRLGVPANRGGANVFPTETCGHFWPFWRPLVGGHTSPPL